MFAHTVNISSPNFAKTKPAIFHLPICEFVAIFVFLALHRSRLSIARLFAYRARALGSWLDCRGKTYRYLVTGESNQYRRRSIQGRDSAAFSAISGRSFSWIASPKLRRYATPSPTAHV